jgi:RNA polymerase sigma-70 factor (ECF subfamily)
MTRSRPRSWEATTVIRRSDVENLYRTRGPQAVRRARSILGDEEAARDVVHEVFTSLLEKPEQFQERSSLSTFLYAAVTHRCLQRLRDTRNRTRLLEGRAQEATASQGAGASPAERLLLLRQMIARVPAELADVAIYHYVDSLTYDQIADILGCSKRTVSDLLQRFRSTCEALVLAEAS